MCCGSGAVGVALAAALGRVDLLVANAPYIPTEAIGLLPPEARVHEPRVALDGGADGLDVQRKVAAAALVTGWPPRVACLHELDATVVIGTKT